MLTAPKVRVPATSSRNRGCPVVVARDVWVTLTPVRALPTPADPPIRAGAVALLMATPRTTPLLARVTVPPTVAGPVVPSAGRAAVPAGGATPSTIVSKVPPVVGCPISWPLARSGTDPL